jgi:PAS domain S-box-containing protein
MADREPFDITERKGREEELWEATDRFSGAFDYAAIGMALVGTDGSFLQANRALCELTGYSRQELLAKTFQDITHPDDLETDLGYVRQMLNGEIDTYQMEKRYFRADGSLVWILLSVSLVHDSIGNPLYFVSQIQDITPRKIAEQEREALEKRLYHAQKMEAVGVLAGGAAHNFNNLLSVIQNYASFVIEELDEDDPKRADMDEIVAASKRASKIVKELLAFSRTEGADPDPVNLNDVVSDAEGLIRGTIGNAVRLRVRTEQCLSACFINPGQMDQIILNLVLNARQAMPDGGDLTIETSNQVVSVAEAKSHPGLSQGDYVSVSVSDTGIGMSEEVKSRIFEPFFTTKGRAVASGLGLASVYGIVKQWGGYVAVKSEVGSGTTMTIYLPAFTQPVSDADKTTQT